MKATDSRPAMRVLFDAHHCSLTSIQTSKMFEGIDNLARQVEHFPLSDFHILVERNDRSNEYSVKVTLILDGATLVGNDHDPGLHAAFERCLRGLSENVQAYKDRLGRVPDRQKKLKGTHQGLEPTVEPDPAALDTAVAAGNYPAFRLAALGYEDVLHKRVGRWVERYPEIAARIGSTLQVNDLVEEVFLNAFENYERRPKGIRLGDWLDSLIDPAVKVFQGRSETELENVQLARAAVESAQLRPEK
jgi:ribosome-associated translation inhibitor RaiA